MLCAEVGARPCHDELEELEEIEDRGGRVGGGERASGRYCFSKAPSLSQYSKTASHRRRVFVTRPLWERSLCWST